MDSSNTSSTSTAHGLDKGNGQGSQQPMSRPLSGTSRASSTSTMSSVGDLPSLQRVSRPCPQSHSGSQGPFTPLTPLSGTKTPESRSSSRIRYTLAKGPDSNHLFHKLTALRRAEGSYERVDTLSEDPQYCNRNSDEGEAHDTYASRNSRPRRRRVHFTPESPGAESQDSRSLTNSSSAQRSAESMADSRQDEPREFHDSSDSDPQSRASSPGLEMTLEDQKSN